MVACIATFQSAIRQTYKLIHACLCMVSSAISFGGYYWEIATHSVNILGRRGKSINKCHWPWIKVCFFFRRQAGNRMGASQESMQNKPEKADCIEQYLCCFFVCVSFHHSTIPCLTPCLALFELKYSSAFGGLSERLLNMSWSFKVLKQISLFSRICYFGCNNSARVTRSHVDFIESIILRLPLARCLYIGPSPWDFEHKGQIR